MENDIEMPLYITVSKPFIKVFDDSFLIEGHHFFFKKAYFKFNYADVYKVVYLRGNKWSWLYDLLSLILTWLTFSYIPENHDNNTIKIYMKDRLKLNMFKIKGVKEDIDEAVRLINSRLC